MAAQIYYFDGSDAAATDPDANWSSDANAFDGDITTFATPTLVGDTTTKYLMAEGTNAPSTGPAIGEVWARMFGNSNVDSSVSTATIYTDGLAENLGSCINSTSAATYGSYVVLTAPSGGWTWAKVQSLEVKIAFTTDNGVNKAISRVEIKVNPSAATTIYTVQGFQ